MDSQMRDEDIFYSDDEFSDSEDFYQVGPKRWNKFQSNGFLGL